MDSFTDDVSLLNEYRTRKELIDPTLEKADWLKKYIKEEVNSVKSNFKDKNYVNFDGNPKRGKDRYIDYVLLDVDNTPLAIIEAKRFSKNPDKGRIQARTYAKDIEGQVDHRIPIFMTNGTTWCFIDEDGIERKVSGPFSQDDLKRRRDLYENYRDPTKVKVNPRIVDRPRSIQIVKELSEHFAEGHRKALVQMATGTGKTRVAMAIIDLLINANVVRNILFIADRIALVNQTKSSGFKQFFREPVADLREGYNNTSRLYVTTVQTLMGGKPKRMFERYTPGFFDLIVFDEAHRSIYDKNNMIAQYFDSLKVGLTATPRDRETQSTYDLFDCSDDKPTVEYSYDEAVRDGVLVPYAAEILETKVLSMGIYGGELTKNLKKQLEKQEEDPDSFEVSGSDFDKVFMDDKTNELIIREYMDLCYKSDEGKPAKTIFFCASQRHARRVKKIFGRLFPRLSNDVQVITSDMSRAEDEVKRFQLDSEPRIALSVGMLDTGVDIPEVCNLVFVKPVYSHIRFWQMVGRGTRNFKSCKHPEWLPNREKDDFLIFDFTIGGFSNVRYHELDLNVAKERDPQKSILTQIFENRVELLKKPLNDEQKTLIEKKIINDIDSLDTESFIVREKLPVIADIKKNSDNLTNYTKQLNNDVAPLMILEHGANSQVSSFIMKTERLFNFILEGKKDRIESMRKYTQSLARNIIRKDNLTEVKQKKEQLIKIMQDEFWIDLDFEDVEFLVREIAPLIKYYQPDKITITQIDAPDYIMSREKFVHEVEEDHELREFLDTNPIAGKIKDGIGITSYELIELERELSTFKAGLTIENIQNFQKKDFLLFIREIIGLSYKDDPKTLIENRFNQYIIQKSHYNHRQLDFLLLLKKVFAERKQIKLADLSKSPLGDEHPLDYFHIDELQKIVEQCNQIKMC